EYKKVIKKGARKLKLHKKSPTAASSFAASWAYKKKSGLLRLNGPPVTRYVNNLRHVVINILSAKGGKGYKVIL
ncbi:MAG TPA: hypothetical protein DCD97_06575, partial [Firmicutes bacterium]|nr:hypothetical protein [Bacillota bacterium]